MKALPFVTLLFYIIIIVCKASASCPCHIPCTGRMEICTCYGPCGDDGYGCKTNGEEYEYFDQIQCQESKYQVQCIRHAIASPHDTLDDTNPFAAYEQAARDNIMDASFDDDSTAATSLSWFGGNWFDFWGQNDAQFFSQENLPKAKYDGDINIDSFASQSAQRTLQTAKSSSTQILNELGRNAAGYKIIALPLYILIICIVSAAILGMLMCAGFVYCGLHCCCPLPPQSPILTSQQRSRALEMTRALQALTLGGGPKHSDSDYSVYHRMRNALHNATADEASSMLSNDEYVDSEDDNDCKDNVVTRGDIDEYDDYDYNDERKQQEIESFALIGTCDSDIDHDSDDEMIRELGDLIETRLSKERSLGEDHDVNVNEDMDGTYMDRMVTIENEEEEEEESGDEPEVDETENEGAALIIDSGNNSGSKSSNLP